jgi:hypothetical protein
VKVLVAERIADAGIARLRQAATVDAAAIPSREALLAMIGDYDALIVRSATQVDAELLLLRGDCVSSAAPAPVATTSSSTPRPATACGS